jgi:acetyl esterase/lipase
MTRSGSYWLPVMAALSMVAGPAGTIAASAAEDPLTFPKGAFTEETLKVRTSQGEKTVVFRAYRHIPYVAKPVDREYQSLDVSVPIQVDGIPINAANAPILFVVPVGGYMSASNAGRGGGGGRPPGRSNGVSSNRDLALAAGYVVVVPGCRGRDNKAADGTYYGKAPAAIVDLKAAVRYVRHNAGVLPGNTRWIVTTGVSAGGALSALLGASGDSRLYEPYLREIGAADASDAVFGSADFCPIMDLEHADMAYEWMYGTLPARSGPVDQGLSKELKTAFAAYQASLKLKGRNGYGVLTAENYDKYLLQTYVIPSANRFLQGLNEANRQEYLAKNKWITWTGAGASFSFPDYAAHVGRMKGLPAFDDFDARQPEPIVFGNKTTNARHFTNFSLRHTTGNDQSAIDAELQAVVNLMNPMYFIGRNSRGLAGHWWIRQGSSDNHTSLTVLSNLAASLENRGKDVNALLYWDAGHGADEDAEDFIAWIGRITGYGGKGR